MYPQVRQSTINTFLSGTAPNSVLFQGEQDVDKGRSTIPLTTLTPLLGFSRRYINNLLSNSFEFGAAAALGQGVSYFCF